MARRGRGRECDDPEATLNLDALVAPLRADVVSGAAVVARTAAEVVRRVAIRAPAGSTADLRDTLASLAVRILDAQPAMAPLVALGSRTLDAVGDAASLEDARRAAAHEAEAFREALERGTKAAGKAAARELPRQGVVLTLSSSSTVRAALLQRAGGTGLEVVCLESRPMSEGRTLAEALAVAGIPTVYAVDAAAYSLIDEVDVVLMGADSVGDRGIVNKIGSAALARLAMEKDVPVMVAVDATKLLPPGFPQAVEDSRPAREVWRAPGGIRVWNRYFEVVPRAWVSAIVTGDGARSPEEMDRERRRLRAPEELRRWAEGRTGAGTDAGEEPGPASGV